jgi:alpha-ketoglutarate-dependent taurine dioxygenase
MNHSDVQKPSLRQRGTIKRQGVSVSQDALVKIELLQPETALPLVVRPVVEGVNLIAWIQNHRSLIETHLLKHGAILFRNFQSNGIPEFEQCIRTLSGELLDYSYRSTSRSQVSGKIYTSTEYPPEQTIPLHNELSYSRNWVMKIWFHCIQAAQQGGETPIADSRRVFQKLDPRIIELFSQHGVMYVRNYGNGLDLSWQNVFQTDSKEAVERYCRAAGIDFEWSSPDQLRTQQVCQAIATHPKTGESVWFNQAHLFHISNLDPTVRQGLLASFSEDKLPRNAYYGNGSVIETSVLDEIRGVYQQEAVIFPWKASDILLLDNMLAAHGRMPFLGSRRVVVGMAEPFSNRV